MERVDVAIVGGGPAGSACAIVCARAGLRTVVLEREKFPREKVCGDCLNPACWPILRRLGVGPGVRGAPHARLGTVQFVAINGASVPVALPGGEEGAIAMKRSVFDDLLLEQARSAGADVHEGAMVTRLEKAHWGDWKLDIVNDKVTAPIVVAADGRNSTVARLRNLFPRVQRDRVALQTHIPLPPNFGNRIVIQFLREGYSGQAPVNSDELNLCVAGQAGDVRGLKAWAAAAFPASGNSTWRTITPLARPAVGPSLDNLLLIGDAARVVEPFTGEGIYYALRSGELAAEAIIAITRGQDRSIVLSRFAQMHQQMYRGRLWINRLTRTAVVWPRIGSTFIRASTIQPGPLRFLTRRVTT